MSTLLSLGHGYSARALARHLVPQGWRVIGTTRKPAKAEAFRAEGVEPLIWPVDLGPALAEATHILCSAAPDAEGDDSCVLLVECREIQPERRAELSARLAQLVQRELALECRVELVPMHHLPRTSSGKLSRARARQLFIADQDDPQQAAGGDRVAANSA